MYKFINGKKVYEVNEVDGLLSPLQTAVTHITEARDEAAQAYNAAIEASSKAEQAADALDTYKNTTDRKFVSIDISIASIANIAANADTKADEANESVRSYGIKAYLTADMLPTTTREDVPGFAIALDTLILYTATINDTDVTWSAIGKLVNTGE